MKTEFTIEQTRAFVDKGFMSVSARYVKSTLQHHDDVLRQRDELRDLISKVLGSFSLERTEHFDLMNECKAAIKSTER